MFKSLFTETDKQQVDRDLTDFVERIGQGLLVRELGEIK